MNRTTNNSDLPYEYQMRIVLKKYEKLVEENQKLRDVIEQIDRICPIEELPNIAVDIQRLKNIKRVSEMRKEKIKAYREGFNRICEKVHLSERMNQGAGIDKVNEKMRLLYNAIP